MRECARVLVPGGRVAVYAIHTPPGLSAAEREEAADVGPSLVAAGFGMGELLERAGFVEVRVEDRTAALAQTCGALLALRRKMERELRAQEGDAYYEEELRKKRGMLEGIRRGLILRSQVTGMTPTSAGSAAPHRGA